MDDRYGTDVLAAGWRERQRREVPRVEASADLVVEVFDDGFCGAVVGVQSGLVELEDRRGARRLFPLGPGFLIDGADVVLVAPTAPAPDRRTVRTASGSFAVEGARARVARASRILVEGRHDAELVEKVWGDDLRIEGVVVEYLQGVDLLQAALDDEPPSAERRYGVLVDHLVPGSKESRVADEIRSSTCGSASRLAPSASPAGPRCRAASTTRPACAARSAGRPTTRPTSRAPGSASSRRSAATATSSPRCSAASRSSSTG